MQDILTHDEFIEINFKNILKLNILLSYFILFFKDNLILSFKFLSILNNFIKLHMPNYLFMDKIDKKCVLFVEFNIFDLF